jgi:DNA-binding response OmpR family regulator
LTDHSRAHVLIVEDDAMLRETLMWVLQDHGFDVALAIDGPDAVRQAALSRPGVVVLDMNLPGLDGAGVAAELRARYGGDLPILVVTADGQSRQKAERVGAYAFLHKPFDMNALVQQVQVGLSRPDRS